MSNSLLKVDPNGITEKKKREKTGILYAVITYTIWGLIPLYWIPITRVPAFEILAHRIFWSLLFMILLLLVTRKFGTFLRSFIKMLRSPLNLILIITASVLVSLNWFTYIWAVTNGHVIESSMGYYINPLVSILLGIIVLREKLNAWQIVAFLLAACGVLIQTIEFGQVPLIALTLAFSFGFYGLAKKLIRMDPALELTFETLFVAPVALYYLIHVQMNGTAAFGTGAPLISLFLIGTGVITAVPLLYFAKAAQRISLTMIGFFQYIAPTIQLIIGIAIFKEPFSSTQVITFSFIWFALIVFSLSGMSWMKRMIRHRHSARSSHR